ncbi:hypothetical protein SMSP2_00557 [Limihaloglobus sulfuriphilus]|uniref:Galanin n=1 Tax=Limihaloglobus sulfuriphilus TaxID=1851148 RepID=A0A1Q2MC18_9BACT|nr:DUF3137 domain-containing protein [Limihaloglobus sulfuriphilus]AQQ70214.1 hypothetical protein SMSP2_00557 [Limihaloglobus sulfuriphilus]
MKTIEELKDFYSKELEPELVLLEDQRKKVLRNLLITAAVTAVIVFGGVAAIVFGGGTTPGLGIIVFPVVITFVICSFALKFFSKSYVADFKNTVINRIIKFIDPQLHFEPYACIPSHVYDASDIFQTRYDEYKGEDLVEGTVGKTPMSFSELHTEYITRHKNRKQHHTIFRGLFFVAEFNKHFEGKTLVLPDTAQKLFGRLGQRLQSMNFTRDELVKLEDPEFERHFAVHSTDQIEARYILSTSLMKRITDFKQRTGREIFISFRFESIFVAIKYNKNLFEPKIFTTLLNFAPIREYYEDLAMAIGIVEDLNLNTRIWSKR